MPPATPILDLIQAFRMSKTMFTAVSLGLFDHLHEGPASAPEVADSLHLDESATARLLDACAGLGLLFAQDGRYTNTDLASSYLRRDSPDTLAGYILYSDQVLYTLWSHLEDAIRSGTNRWEQSFAVHGPIFDNFFRTPEAQATFLSGMNGLGRLSSPQIVRVFNLSRFQHLVDLGGATGHLAIAACERYGSLRATVFDLPSVVPHAEAHIQASPAASRLTAIGGDFFADPLPPGDIYVLGRILHDWTDAKIRALLAKIHDALPPGGAILIAESLLDDDQTGPIPTLMQSLSMLVCTEGRERTASGYRALLESAGFTGFESRRTGSPLDAVLAIRKQ